MNVIVRYIHSGIAIHIHEKCGIDFEELREMVRWIAKREVMNMTDTNQVKVVVESCNSTGGGSIHTNSASPNAPSGYTPYRCDNTGTSHSNCPGLNAYNPAPSCRDMFFYATVFYLLGTIGYGDTTHMNSCSSLSVYTVT